MKTVFLSYSSQDKFFCELLRLKLQEQGITVWRDVNDLQAGADWRYSIDAGISESELIILVMSIASCASHYVTYEWASAMGKLKPILPILLEPCDRHPKIEPIQYIDFNRHDDATWHRVVNRVKEIIGEKEDAELSEKSKATPDSASLTSKEIEARDKIKAYLFEKGYRMVSYGRIREKINDDYSDEFLVDLIDKVDDFAIACLKGPKFGVKLR